MKKAAIVVYVESGHPVAISKRLGGAGKFVLETRHLLHRSLVTSGACEAFDIVACGDPVTLDQLPDDHIVKVPFQCDSFWSRYEYGKSIACLLDPRVKDVLGNYQLTMRSDTDVFLTPNTIKLADADVSSDILYCGRGGYFNEGVGDKLAAVAEREGFTVPSPIHSLGSTLFGRTSSVIRWARTTEYLLRTLLTKDFATSEGAWPGWYRGVSLLYAGEIATNFHHEGRINQTTFQFDGWSSDPNPIADRCVHLHCWHVDNVFSKFWWYNGKYDEMLIPKEPITAAEYCLATAFA